LNDHSGKVILFKKFRQSGEKPLWSLEWHGLSGRNYQLASIVNISYKIGFTFEDTTT